MKEYETKGGTRLPLLNLKGKDYLQVAHRLVWFREEKPDWTIETKLNFLQNKAVIAEAMIKDQSGRLIAMAHKYEDSTTFADYIEKCETSAIGRALGFCGYGTQFCGDELDEGQRLTDSPVDRPKAIINKTNDSANVIKKKGALFL